MIISLFTAWQSTAASRATPSVADQASLWRAERRLIDIYKRIPETERDLAHAIKTMDAAGIGVVLTLQGATAARSAEGSSVLKRRQQFVDRLHPGRFVQVLSLDYARIQQDTDPDGAVMQIAEGQRDGVVAIEALLNLGSKKGVAAGKSISAEDPRLASLWQACGDRRVSVFVDLRKPAVSQGPDASARQVAHVAQANRVRRNTNDGKILENLLSSHPETTFICVAAAATSDDLSWLDGLLDKHENMTLQLIVPTGELTAPAREALLSLLAKRSQRLLLAGAAAGGADSASLIKALELPAAIWRAVYLDNARKLFARALPRPVVVVRHIQKDFEIDGDVNKTIWRSAAPVRLESETADYRFRPAIASSARLLWSDKFLYLAYECAYTKLTVFDPPQFDRERSGLWNRDVVEAFIGTDDKKIRRYFEFQSAPTNEKLDLKIGQGRGGMSWNSGFTTKTRVDEDRKVWTTEWRIPIESISATKPEPGVRWRINLFRCDSDNKAFLAWNPSLTPSFHVPSRFGVLEFAD